MNGRIGRLRVLLGESDRARSAKRSLPRRRDLPPGGSEPGSGGAAHLGREPRCNGLPQIRQPPRLQDLGLDPDGQLQASSARRAVCICGGEPAVTIGMLKRLRARTGRLGGGGRRCASSSGELSLAAPIGDREASSGEKDALAEPELWLREARRTLSVKSRMLGRLQRRGHPPLVELRRRHEAELPRLLGGFVLMQVKGADARVPLPGDAQAAVLELLRRHPRGLRELREGAPRGAAAGTAPTDGGGAPTGGGQGTPPHDDALPVDAFIPASQDISSELAAWARDSSSSSGLNSLLLAAPGDVGDRCAPRGWAACLQGAAASARRARTAH
eukprot:CAMPEP_0175626872 /NCGR_PEP_ID=MMETSP0096-20121207/71208_1 /TAXON_ID=311494 /ORGANISM="Alexandrium monilatum, Strain CCMP3105" /LENGTH=329 /DNA_ID=CAMNT_0016932253 /DNA_START=316 /DNA_END=1304 /DNA_ORIENTATION=+